ncbi:hypothetical protein D3C73_1208030 [compost metagenome]
MFGLGALLQENGQDNQNGRTRKAMDCFLSSGSHVFSIVKLNSRYFKGAAYLLHPALICNYQLLVVTIPGIVCPAQTVHFLWLFTRVGRSG